MDAGTVQFLRQGKDAVEELVNKQRELGVVSKEDAETVRQYKQAWHDSSTSIRIAFLKLAVTVIPILEKMVNGVGKFAAFLAKHKDVMIAAVVGIAAPFIALAAAFVVANAGIILVAAGIATLVTAISLAYDDIKAFFQGTKSLTGALVNSFKKMVSGIGGTLDNLYDKVVSVFSKIKGFFTAFFD